MKQWLYRIQPLRLEMLVSGGTQEESAVLAQHFDYLKRLSDEGVVQLAGRTLLADYHSFGIVIFQATDEEEALAVMRDDPGVRERLFRAELFPWRTALPLPPDDGGAGERPATTQEGA